MEYEKFNPLENARLALNYLTAMTDVKYDHLPYWLINIGEMPAYAEHSRVDDAELVASWYEAIVCMRHMLNTEAGREVEEGFKKHILCSWGEDGLR